MELSLWWHRSSHTCMRLLCITTTPSSLQKLGRLSLFKRKASRLLGRGYLFSSQSKVKTRGNPIALKGKQPLQCPCQGACLKSVQVFLMRQLSHPLENESANLNSLQPSGDSQVPLAIPAPIFKPFLLRVITLSAPGTLLALFLSVL